MTCGVRSSPRSEVEPEGPGGLLENTRRPPSQVSTCVLIFDQSEFFSSIDAVQILSPPRDSSPPSLVPPMRRFVERGHSPVLGSTAKLVASVLTDYAFLAPASTMPATATGCCGRANV